MRHDRWQRERERERQSSNASLRSSPTQYCKILAPAARPLKKTSSPYTTTTQLPKPTTTALAGPCRRPAGRRPSFTTNKTSAYASRCPTSKNPTLQTAARAPSCSRCTCTCKPQLAPNSRLPHSTTGARCSSRRSSKWKSELRILTEHSGRIPPPGASGRPVGV